MLAVLLLAATVATTPIPLDSAHRAFEEIRLASEEEGGRLWGVPLYGPTIFVDPKTRFAVANQQDAGGALERNGTVYTGTLPQDVVIANTGVDWSGTRWTMVVWPAVSSRTVPRRRLLFHESWHRIQDSIGLSASDKPVAELDTVDGRYWLRLELRALAAALRSSGDDRKAAIADAAAFRAKRRSLFAGLDLAERALESNEGLAEFTGHALRGTTELESRLAFARVLETLDPDSAFARSFAYQTGPAYGLLLNDLAPGWTRKFKRSDDFSALLCSAAGVTPSVATADGNAIRYDGPALLAFERKRDIERRVQRERHQQLFVTGPLLEMPMANARFGFDPDRVVPLAGVGSVHPKLDVVADWGKLTASSEAVITDDFTRFLVPAPVTLDPASQTLAGPGWTLELTPGWTIVPGPRSGDWRVAPRNSQSSQQ